MERMTDEWLEELAQMADDSQNEEWWETIEALRVERIALQVITERLERAEAALREAIAKWREITEDGQQFDHDFEQFDDFLYAVQAALTTAPAQAEPGGDR